MPRLNAIFCRAFGAIYICAFVSLAVQVHGLFGERGILPLARSLMLTRQHYGNSVYLRFPSLFWIGSSDHALSLVCALGLLGGLGLLAAPNRPKLKSSSALAAWIAYLSFVSVGAPFLHYQWDALLLEAGFLTIWLAAAPDRLTIWAFRALLFRLMLASGLVKLLSGDPTWRHFDALRFHYETQPLPTPLAWYLHQLPASFQRLSCAFTFAVECALPFLLFAGPRARRIAAAGFALLQVLILLSGNYGFFNWLTLVLCFWWAAEPPIARSSVGRIATGLVLALSVCAGLESVVPLPAPVSAVVDVAEGWGVVGHYGLFAVMTTERDELEIQGSDDGQTWKAYGFRWKPGDPRRAPSPSMPHMPRLDWQLWFAALDLGRATYWLEGLIAGLRANEPTVLSLLNENPFSTKPPRHFRLARYRYRFTTWAEKHATGNWWARELTGVSEGD